VPRIHAFPLCSLIGLWLCVAPSASANSIAGLSIDVTSVFDGQTPQNFNFNNINATRIDGGIFSWMTGIDPATNLEFIPGTPNGDQTRNTFDVNFSSGDNTIQYQPTDTIILTMTLSGGYTWNTDFFALVIADDVQVPVAHANGSTFTFEMTNLDQANGNGGQAQYIFDVEPPSLTPEPGTTVLFALGSAGLLMLQRRRGSRSREA
jgi:hypothetical protein